MLFGSIPFLGSFYAFVPAYDFTNVAPVNTTIRIENDFTAWLGVMRRVNYLLKAEFDLADLEQKSQNLIRTVETKMNELDQSAPQLGVKDYLRKLSDDFTELPFDPLSDLWDEKLRRILNKLDESGEERLDEPGEENPDL